MKRETKTKITNDLILKKYQNNIASCREKCDDDEKLLWDKINEAIAELEVMEKQIEDLKNEVSFWKDDADKERIGIIIECLKRDCDKKDEFIAKLEEAMKPKTCSTCYWWNDFYTQCNDHNNSLAGVIGYCCNRYEQKEQ